MSGIAYVHEGRIFVRETVMLTAFIKYIQFMCERSVQVEVAPQIKLKQYIMYANH